MESLPRVTGTNRPMMSLRYATMNRRPLRYESTAPETTPF